MKNRLTVQVTQFTEVFNLPELGDNIFLYCGNVNKIRLVCKYMRNAIDSSKYFIFSEELQNISKLQPNKINEFFYGHPFICDMTSILASASIVGLLDGYNTFFGSLVGTIGGGLIPVLGGSVIGGMLFPLALAYEHSNLQGLKYINDIGLGSAVFWGGFSIVAGMIEGACVGYNYGSRWGALLGGLIFSGNYTYVDGLGSITKNLFAPCKETLIPGFVNTLTLLTTRFGLFANHDKVQVNLEEIKKIKSIIRSKVRENVEKKENGVRPAQLYFR